jgi:hypothetical protein
MTALEGSSAACLSSALLSKVTVMDSPIP